MKKTSQKVEMFDPPLKLFVKSLGMLVITLGIIHTGWYFLRQKYVPKEEQAYTPIMSTVESLIEMVKKEKSNDTKDN